MYDIIAGIIDKNLAPLIEQLAELETQLEDMSRRQRGLIRLGKVVKHGKGNKTIQVKHGENVTPFIKWFAACAGDVSEYRLPSINEQVVLLNFGGGDNSSMTIALIGIPSDAFPLPSDNPDETLRVYPDKTAVRYNHKEHKLTVEMAQGSAQFIVPDKVTFDTKLLHCTGDIKADGEITDHTRSMQDDRTIYNSHTHPHGLPNTSVPNQSE